MTVSHLSYSFAKAQGVLLHMPDSAAMPICRHLAEAQLPALIEAQRVAGRLITFETYRSRNIRRCPLRRLSRLCLRGGADGQ